VNENMQRNVSPVVIVIAVVAVIGALALIFMRLNKVETAGYTAPPAGAAMEKKAQEMSAQYGKNMAANMQRRYGGGAGNAPQAPPGPPAGAPAPR
jgi:hypothetical protein